MKLTASNWPSVSKNIAAPHEPDAYSPQAVSQLMQVIDKYVVDVKNVHTQFHALNSISMIDFRTVAERKYYEDAWERFQKEKAKIESRMDSGVMSGNGGMQILAELLKFRQAAELIKCEYIADAMFESVSQHNQAACAAMNFKASISKCVYYLVHKHGVPREQICLIWGGGASQVSAAQKKKAALKNKLMANASVMDLMEELDIDMRDIGLGASVGDDTFVKEQNAFLADESLKLGTQSKDERQRNIDRFQKGKALFCFFTFKAGGVGLSLHHTDELTREKCRRKESGFVFEEDIPSIPTRQRICFVSTTYSAMELVQGLGRCPRLTSLSDTPQVILFYNGTIEQRVSWIVSQKLRCLRKVTRTNEDWTGVILGGVKEDDARDSEAQAIKQLEDGDSQQDDSPLEDEEEE